MKKDKSKISPGDYVGIIGGGQLGRMLAMAAKKLGLNTIVFSVNEDCPAKSVADEFLCGAYEDANLLDSFSRKASVVTYEFESIPLSAVDYINSRVNLYPGRNILAITQDRLSEKSFLNSIGIDCTNFGAVSYEGDIKTYLENNKGESILKTRRNGYDGKLQTNIEKSSDAVECYYKIKEAPAIIEDKVEFDQEFSVIAVRTLDGEFHHYDVVDNTHGDGILLHSNVPSSIDSKKQNDAIDITKKIADELDYVGIIVVEYFLTKSGKILVNEIAPRVHNSGHWTIDACIFDQFTQHIRAICGWPLGKFSRHSDAKMINIIGNDIDKWSNIISDNSTVLHLYGKNQVRPNRKMGHATTIE